jgi:hypothetical protein
MTGLRVAAVALALGAIGFGIVLIVNGGGEKTVPKLTGLSPDGSKTAPVVGALAPVEQGLKHHYPVEVVPASDLPRRPPLVEKPGLPSTIRATQGLLVALPNGGTGHIYRYKSNELAVEGATSFLGRNDPSDGVSGCGRYVYFTRANSKSAGEWMVRVGRILRDEEPRCAKAFIVIE